MFLHNSIFCVRTHDYVGKGSVLPHDLNAVRAIVFLLKLEDAAKVKELLQTILKTEALPSVPVMLIGIDTNGDDEKSKCDELKAALGLDDILGSCAAKLPIFDGKRALELFILRPGTPEFLDWLRPRLRAP